jgi:hypothetical protein
MNGAVTLFPEATAHTAGFNDATIGPDGNLWFVDYHGHFVTYLEEVVLPAEGPASSLVVSDVQTSTDAGAPFAVTVRVLDANGMQIVGFRGTVHFSSSDQQAGLPADYTFTSSDQGVHTFIGIKLKTAGSQTINASDSTDGISASISLTVPPGPAILQFQAVPPVLAYHPFQVTVTAADAFGNRITSYRGTVHLWTSDDEGTVPADYTFTSADQGLHTFTLVLGTPGPDWLTVSDTSGQFPGSTAAITVAQGDASIRISAPATVTLYQRFSLTVSVVDGSGNILTNYRGIVNISTDNANGIISNLYGPVGPYHFTADDAGVHTFTNSFIFGTHLVSNNVSHFTVIDDVNTSLTATTAITATEVPVPGFVHNYPFAGNDGTWPTLPSRFVFTAVGSDGAIWSPSTSNFAGSLEQFTRVTMDGNATVITPAGTGGLEGTAIAAGPDGNLWVGNCQVGAPNSSYITRLTPGGVATNFLVNGTGNGTGVVTSIVAGGDGNMWFMDGPNTIGRITMNGASSYFTVPIDLGLTQLTQLAAGPDGNVWFTTGVGPGRPGTPTYPGSSYVGRITPQGSVTLFPYLGPLQYLTTGSDGNLWAFTPNGRGNGYLVRIAPSGNITRFPVVLNPDTPFVDSQLSSGLIAAPDGNLWMPVIAGGTAGGALIEMSPTGIETTYQLDQYDGLGAGGPLTYSGLVVGPDGNLWFRRHFSGSVDDLTQVVLPAPGPPATLAVSATNNNLSAGSPFAITVRVADAAGHTVTGYGGTVHFSTTAQQAGLPPDYTFTATDRGVHTFIGVSVDTAGAESVTVQDMTSGINGTTSVNVQPGPLAELFVGGGGVTVLIGQPIQITVSGADAFGNLVQGFAGTARFSSSDTAAGLPADYTFTSADNGTHTFSIAFNTAGAQSLNVSDNADGLGAGHLSAIVISALKITAPTSVQAGQLFAVTVSAVDASNHPVSAYVGAIHFSSADQQAGLPADYTFTAADGGVHTFQGVFLGTSGTDQIGIVDKSNASAVASASTSVSAGSLASLAISSSTSAIAGTPIGLTVAAYDRFHNGVTGYSGTVTIATNDPQGIVPGAYQFQASDHGVHTFTGIVLRTAGLQTVTASDSGAGVNNQTSVQVAPAAASRAAISASANSTAGTAVPLTITLQDPYGNVATGYRGTVHFTSSDSQAALPANYAFQASDQGVHTFSNGTLKTAGSESITVTDTSNSITVAKVNITVSPAAATHYMITAPAHAQVGMATGITITAFDPYGNKATGYTGTMHFTSSDLHAGLPADYGFAAADQGSHTFSVIFHAVGNQSLSIRDLGNSVLQATSQKTLVIANDWVTGADAGGGPEVKLFDATTGKAKLDFMAYSPYFLGGVRVALGDIYNTGIPDIITVPGPTGGPDVRIFDGRTGQKVFEFMAFDPRFAGGLFVTVADFNGDGYADIAIGADAGGGPQVKIFSGKGIASGSLQVLASFYAYSPYFNGGVRLASGDINGDGTPDLIAAPGPGGGPDVRVFDGAHLDQANYHTDIIREFMAYSPYFNGGVYLAAGDVNGDGKPDIITGAGAGGGPQVSVFSGVDLRLLEAFMAYSPYFNGGVRVGFALDQDGHGDILTAAGTGGGPHVRVLDGMTLAELDGFFAYSPVFNGGVFIGGE